MDQASLKRLRELEGENSRLKQIVAQQVLDLDALKELAGKEW
jgi:putative transposase